ncbi:MAG: helix-turn-helix domain-containing protein [Phycisphaerae bacterium]
MADHHSILALARLGWSYRRIATELGVDRETVSQHVRAARGDPPDPNAGISMAGSKAVSGMADAATSVCIQA